MVTDKNIYTEKYNKVTEFISKRKVEVLCWMTNFRTCQETCKISNSSPMRKIEVISIASSTFKLYLEFVVISYKQLPFVTYFDVVVFFIIITEND